MNRRKFIYMAIGGAALGYGARGLLENDRICEKALRGTSGAMKKVRRRARALGTDTTLTVYHEDPETAGKALEAAFAEIERVEDLMSLYRPESQLSRLNREGQLSRPDPDLLHVLQTARRISARTRGAFDVTVQPLWDLYAKATGDGGSPTEDEIRSARLKVDWRRLEISPERLRLRGSGMAVTLNGMAQGFATDAACRVLRKRGIRHALIDAGEVGAVGRPFHKEKWTIGIKHPRQQGNLVGVSNLDSRCLATSGDYETKFSADFRAHHLFDPRTGRSPDELASVSVAAPTAFQADALSTAAFVLGLERGRQFLRAISEVDGLFITKKGRISRTKEFPFRTTPQTS